MLPSKPRNALITFTSYQPVRVPLTVKEWQMFSSVTDLFTLILNLGFRVGSAGFEMTGSAGGGVENPPT